MMASSLPRPLATSADTRSGRRREPLGAALLDLGVGQQPLVVPEPARIVVQHDAERRHLLLDLQELVDLLLVLGQRETRAGMLDDIGKLVGHRILVDRHRHAAQRLRRAHRPVEPRPVVADHDQPVATAEIRDRPGPPPARRPAGRHGPSRRSARCRIPFRGRPAGRGPVRARANRSLGNVSRASVARIGRSRRHPLTPRPLDPPFVC